ncbi:MAG: hypothetical protein HY809_02990 [Nitrospirae bacterium]|nr:hypothetical protein [Nitrospirota bacterium]
MLMKSGIRLHIIISGLILLIAAAVSAIDYPHSPANYYDCSNCHDINSSNPYLLPEWTGDYEMQDEDDIPVNHLCRSCHYDGGPTPAHGTHSYLTLGYTSGTSPYGLWQVRCITCHDPHYQQQFSKYRTTGDQYWVVKLLVDTVTASGTSSTLKAQGSPGWTVDAYKSMKVVPNVNAKYPIAYKITGNTSDTLTIKGQVTGVVSGNTFAIIYGKLIRSEIRLDDIINPVSSTVKTGIKKVKLFRASGQNSCVDGDGVYDGVCEVCHTETGYHKNNAGGNHNHNLGVHCTDCHSHKGGFQGGGTSGGHPTHLTAGQGPHLTCQAGNYGCHGTYVPNSADPLFADGEDFDETGICDNCHGGSDGGNMAKTYWPESPGTWAWERGENVFCGSCHDVTQGKTQADGGGDTAPNVMGDDNVTNDGDNPTYGFLVTGHGKPSGNYQRLSWQDTTASGNPAANRQCISCHDAASQHFNNANKRLKAGYENDNNNSNCKQCHNPGTTAGNNPQWYTTYAVYQNSAHGNKKCSDCHDVHGNSGSYIGMTKLNQESLCNQGSCHSGVGGHPGVGSTAFSYNSKNYTLECVSCHNVHVVTGRYNQADQNKSPVTRFADNLNLWGDVSGEKMNAYAGSGTYRKPNGESFTGDQLPDYATFCTDCHGQGGSTNVPFGISWDSDPHGRQSANQPNGYGTCPNWFACGNAFGWDGDDCVGTQEECWPVTPRGAGDQLYSRNVYTHTERVAGANFVLSCTDCHTGHGSGNLGRSNVNGGSFTGNWNSMCNNCHYYYSDWHAGMACGNASCHVSSRMSAPGVGSSSTPHQMVNSSGSGGTRTHTDGLVLKYNFENDLKDSSGWQIDGKWYSTSGSFNTGKSGQAVVLGEDIGVQVGTENGYWSTDEGYHGTWKYTEMKYNTTLEAWVYPTDNAKSEYTIFNKQVGVSTNGSYHFTLKKVNGTLRANFSMAADNNGFTQDGRAGVRGAYSSVAIPLNKWTHVAATFDTGGADRNPADLSVGRIRIYINGEDVTTSDSSGNSMQPGANETSIFAFSENSPWNQAGVCYNDSWCASEFSIGGFDWEYTNFIGRIDEAAVWNITKNSTYFASYDSQAGPYISHVEGLIGTNQLTVRFSEGVYTSTGSSGALLSTDFTLADTGGNNPRTITGVTHTAGSSTAVIAMSAPLVVADVNTDTLRAATASSIYDNYNNAMGTETVTIGLSSQCPTSPVSIQLNEASGSSYIMDSQNILYGAVNGGASTLTGSAYSGGGDGSGRYIMFDYNNSCLQASTAMTLETRIKPTGLSTVTGDTLYVRRILARDGGGNYQLSVWRNNTWNNPTTDTYNAPNYEASIALWIYVMDAHGGSSWKPVLTNYTGAKTGSENDCPIVSDHWYQIKAVWDTSKAGGTPGQFFTPADIFIDDQGTDGTGAGENWTGSINCTDSDQSLKPDTSKFYTEDQIMRADGNFAIGTNRSNPANNLFNGLIDWITWKDSID